MKLKCEKKTVIKVNYSDLERYIKLKTGKVIEIPCLLECGNDTDHEIDVGIHPDWMDEEDKIQIEDFLFGKGELDDYTNFSDIMEVLHLCGMLEKGTYLIRVSW